MLESDTLHESIKNTMIDIMAILYERGIRQVHMGAMMRLLGVPDTKASEHDDEFVELDEKFEALMTELNKTAGPIEVPPGTVFH